MPRFFTTSGPASCARSRVAQRLEPERQHLEHLVPPPEGRRDRRVGATRRRSSRRPASRRPPPPPARRGGRARPRRRARAATRPGGRTAGAGTGSSRRTSPAGQQHRRCGARPDRSAPAHSTASLTSPRSETSSTSTSSGSASWSTPGATFTPSERTRSRHDSTSGSGGRVRPRVEDPPAAGPARGVDEDVGRRRAAAAPSTSARTSDTGRPSTSALARASSSRASSRSTPTEPAGSASRSPPTEQHRSSTGRSNRRARQARHVVRRGLLERRPGPPQLVAARVLGQGPRAQQRLLERERPEVGPERAHGLGRAQPRGRATGRAPRRARRRRGPRRDSSRRAASGVRRRVSGAATCPCSPAARPGGCRTTRARRWCCGCSTGRRSARPRRCRSARRGRRGRPWA